MPKLIWTEVTPTRFAGTFTRNGKELRIATVLRLSPAEPWTAFVVGQYTQDQRATRDGFLTLAEAQAYCDGYATGKGLI